MVYWSRSLRLYLNRSVSKAHSTIIGEMCLPVCGDSLVSLGPLEVVIWASNGEEALQDVLVKNTFGVFG